MRARERELVKRHADSAVVTSLLVPCEITSSFRGETVGGIAKCRLVSQATESSDSQKSTVFAGYPYGG